MPHPNAPAVHPLVSPWGRFGLYSFFIDAPEPAIVDTGIASSPVEGMAPALAKLGRRIEDVRWILLTHGHIDHIGGAHALWELTGRRANVVISEIDAPFLRARRAHVDEFLQLRGDYITDPGAEAAKAADAAAAISGEMEPTHTVTGGETLDLGGVSVSVHATPGHTPGAVAYVIDDQRAAFVGDSVQGHGAASGFPGYGHPAQYRASLEYLRDVVRPEAMFLGHPYRDADGIPFGVTLDREGAQRALQQSIDHEARIATAVREHLPHGPAPTDSPYTPFAAVAAALGYTGDPTLEPSPFFTTMHGYTRGA